MELYRVFDVQETKQFAKSGFYGLNTISTSFQVIDFGILKSY